MVICFTKDLSPWLLSTALGVSDIPFRGQTVRYPDSSKISVRILSHLSGYTGGKLWTSGYIDIW